MLLKPLNLYRIFLRKWRETIWRFFVDLGIIFSILPELLSPFMFFLSLDGSLVELSINLKGYNIIYLLYRYFKENLEDIILIFTIFIFIMNPFVLITNKQSVTLSNGTKVYIKKIYCYDEPIRPVIVYEKSPVIDSEIVLKSEQINRICLYNSDSSDNYYKFYFSEKDLLKIFADPEIKLELKTRTDSTNFSVYLMTIPQMMMKYILILIIMAPIIIVFKMRMTDYDD